VSTVTKTKWPPSCQIAQTKIKFIYVFFIYSSIFHDISYLLFLETGDESKHRLRGSPLKTEKQVDWWGSAFISA